MCEETCHACGETFDRSAALAAWEENADAAQLTAPQRAGLRHHCVECAAELFLGRVCPPSQEHDFDADLSPGAGFQVDVPGEVPLCRDRRANRNGDPGKAVACRLVITRDVSEADEAEQYGRSLRAAGWKVQHQRAGCTIEQPNVDDQLLIGLRRSLEMHVPPEELRERVTRLIDVIAGDLEHAATP